MSDAAVISSLATILLTLFVVIYASSKEKERKARKKEKERKAKK